MVVILATIFLGLFLGKKKKDLQQGVKRLWVAYNTTGL
jgi:hypothetical protein